MLQTLVAGLTLELKVDVNHVLLTAEFVKTLIAVIHAEYFVIGM